MKRKTVFFLALLVVVVIFSQASYASIPDMTVVIGSRAFSLDYANDTSNESEIVSAIVEGNNQIFIKVFGGQWIDNNTGNVTSPSVIPEARYKDPVTGEERIYGPGDDSSGPARFEVIDIR